MSPGACRLIRVASRLRRSASLNRVAMDSTPSSTNKVIPIVAAPPEDAEVFLYAATKKIHPRSVSGLFARWRWGLVFLTQIVFYGLPWLEWGQRQAVLFDLGARRFYLFGIVLYPQDFIYLTGLLVISALSLFLFTAVAGRLWCGYACPQTVYTEIFMWVEHKIEGNRTARMRLDAEPMSLEKLVKTTHGSEKVLVFSQFADTVRYLEEQLRARGVSGMAGVTGDASDPTARAWRVSPISNDKRNLVRPEDELRVLVATDVLSEGQNLQDCSVVVNFDLPWAIIRLIQRAGRVDRIGQRAEQILCYSFLPAEGVERILG